MKNFNRFYITLGIIFVFVFYPQPGFDLLKATDAYHDLEMVSITTNPTTPAINQPCQIKVKVKYSGEVSLTDSTGLNSYNYQFTNFDLSSSVLLAPSPSSPIATGKTFEYVFNGVFTKMGESALSFVVNNEYELSETRTSNNDMRVKVEVGSAEDLKVESISVAPSIPIAGQEAIITVTIKNNGLVDLSSNVGFDFVQNFDGFTETSRSIPQVSLGEKLKVAGTIKYIFNGTFKAEGKKTLTFSINNENRIIESKLTNNSITKEVSVGSPSNLDISVSSVELSKKASELLVGDSVSIIVKVKNNSAYALTSGNGLLERDYKYAEGGNYNFIFDNFTLENYSHGDYPTTAKPLAPGSVISYSFSGKIKKAGSGQVYFKIDTKNDLVETDETNNELSAPYVIYNNQAEIDNFGILSTEVLPISTSSVWIVWSTDRETSGSVWYKQKDSEEFDRFLLTTGLKAWPSSKDATTHKITLSNLKPGEEYRYIIKATKNNIKKESALLIFTTPKNDNFVLSKKPVYARAEDGKINVKWSSNLASNSYVYYKKDGKVEYSKAGTDNSVLDHEVDVSGLENAKYFFYVYSKAKSGAKIESAIEGFTLSGNQMQSVGQAAAAGTSTSKTVSQAKSASTVTVVKSKTLYNSLKGKIILTVEKKGEAYYVNPKSETIHYLGRPNDAFGVMREQGVGISNVNLYKIPVGVSKGGPDADADGLSDSLESALGLDPKNKDTDKDGFSDKVELEGGYNPWGDGKQTFDNAFKESQKGKILLQVEKNGEAWYVSPADGKRYFLGRPDDAFGVMRSQGVGITNSNFNALN